MTDEQASPSLKPSARRLLDAAERLMARDGIEQVPLEHIAFESGQSNRYAVQYHFGSRQGIVDAIFDERLPRIEERRSACLARLRDAGTLGTRDLVWALFRPLVEEVDGDGRHNFVLFSARVFQSPNYAGHWRNSPFTSAASEIVRLLEGASPHLPPQDFTTRIRLLIEMFWSAMLLIDRADPLSDFGVPVLPDASRILANFVDIATAALLAPPSDTPLQGWRLAGRPDSAPSTPRPDRTAQTI